MSATDLRVRMRTMMTEAAASVGAQPKPWYAIKALSTSDTPEAEVRIYDEVSPWGITAEDFVRELRALDVDTIRLRMNTPGGLVFDGVTIYNALRDHKAAVHVTVDGFAASIGSVIAMAGDTVTMNRGSHMMIHDASGGVLGNASEMREFADVLDKLSQSIAGIYADRAGGTADTWRALMLKETWYTAEEAVAAHLADTVPGADKEQSTKDATATNRSRSIVTRHNALVARKGVKA